MNNFKDINLRRTYTSLDSNILQEVVNAILKLTKRYDRAVGFFSSSWLKEVSSGLARFIVTGGKARVVTSIRLSEKDWEVIKSSVDKESEISRIIDYKVLATIEELQASLEQKTLATLSLLIREKIIEFKFAVPCGPLAGGIFHSKVSIFYDNEDNYIALSGSQNDSHQANINEETINVFTSWGEGGAYALDLKDNFEEKWRGNNKSLRTYSISETISRKIIEVGEQHPEVMDSIKKELLYSYSNKPVSKAKQLRPYQDKAIKGWFANNCKGLFEMATGTGKTFTSISAVDKLYERDKRVCFIVLVPYQHLAIQWSDELKENGYDPVLCFNNRNQWKPELNRKINKFKSKDTDKLCIVALYATASMPEFQTIISTKINKLNWMLLADEVHNAGSRSYQKTLFNDAKYRLGLSATPTRWFDEEGSEVIQKFFDKTVIEYSLSDAIDSQRLTKYRYYPVQVEFSDDELAEYEDLSDKIAKLASKEQKTVQDTQILERLLIKRASVIGKAENKLDMLIDLVKKHKKELEDKGEKYQHNIYYSSPGEHKKVLAALDNLGIRVHEFVSDVSKEERNKVLKSFADGKIDGLVAIRCLDEGVDVPATRRAYIMASTTNPKEFIQRRGRILRKYPGKTLADIYDFILGPWTPERYSEKTGKSLLNRELPRFAEFNSCAVNKPEARAAISPICEEFGLINELDMKPYEIYKRNKELLSENTTIDNSGETQCNSSTK